MSKNKEVSADVLSQLKESYPVQEGGNAIFYPRISMLSQDKVEGTGKKMKVVAEAGTFYTEKQSEEVDDNGKALWEKDELGTSLEAIILYQRKQLKYYDESTQKYTSSPVYDDNTEVIPLFSDKKEIDRGTPTELKARKQYAYMNAKSGKPASYLEDNVILYVLYKDEVYQINLRGTSMYSFKTYAKSTLPPSVLTKFSSTPEENGKTRWNKMSFKVVRQLDADEAESVLEKVKEIKENITSSKAQYALKAPSKADAEFDAIEGEKSKDF